MQKGENTWPDVCFLYLKWKNNGIPKCLSLSSKWVSRQTLIARSGSRTILHINRVTKKMSQVFLLCGRYKTLVVYNSCHLVTYRKPITRIDLHNFGRMRISIIWFNSFKDHGKLKQQLKFTFHISFLVKSFAMSIWKKRPKLTFNPSGWQGS